MRGPAPALLVLLLLLAGAGCGSSTGDATPALTTRLERVDAAAVADDPEALAAAVAGLLRAVDEAEAAGDLGGAAAQRIRAAAEVLLDAADTAGPAEPSEPQESTTPPTPPSDSDTDDKDDKDDKDEGHRRSEGKAKGHDGHDD